MSSLAQRARGDVAGASVTGAVAGAAMPKAAVAMRIAEAVRWRGCTIRQRQLSDAKSKFECVRVAAQTWIMFGALFPSDPLQRCPQGSGDDDAAQIPSFSRVRAKPLLICHSVP